MSTFKAQFTNHTEVIIDGDSCEPGWIRLAIEDRGVHVCGAVLDPADAPAIALAVLEAGGHNSGGNDWRSDTQWAVYYLTQAIKEAEAKAAAAAEEAARGKRRDELAREIYSWDYKVLAGPGKRAIDRIIDGELELAKERAK